MLWPLFFLALTIASWIYWLVACLCVVAFFAERQPTGGSELPPASVLKPLCGLDADLYENLVSFLEQDYPVYEVLFGVSDPEDPALAVARQLQREFPDQKIRVFVAPLRGPNRKVSILCHLAEHAQYDTLVICDSDMRVTRDYLRRIVAPLTDPAVGLVTCLYRGEQPDTLAAVLEALYMGATFLPSVLVGRRYLQMRFALGATMALRRKELCEIGGFESLLDYLADDYQLGARVAATGHRVHLSDYVIQSVLGPTRFREQWEREVRWAKCSRVSRPLEFPALLVTFSTPLALLAAVSLGLSALGCAVIVMSLAVRWLVVWTVARRTHDRVLREAWIWLPLRDLLTAAVWCVALVGRQVTWRGRRFIVQENGRLQPLVPQEVRQVAR